MTATMTSNAATDPDPSGDILLNLIVALLAPMFLGVSGGDIRFARDAAIQTVAAYRATTQADLLSIAQIIGFGIAALGSLSLSMADDISLSMTLRLRSNANALNRSAEQNRKALAQSRHDAAVAWPTDVDDEPDLPDTTSLAPAGLAPAGSAPAGFAPIPTAPAQPAATPPQAREQPTQPASRPQPAPNLLATMTDEQRHQTNWANAMSKVAAELTASLPTLPPDQRGPVAIRAAALTTTARELRAGISVPRPRPGGLDGIIRSNPA